jgi:hypothetical protein
MEVPELLSIRTALGCIFTDRISFYIGSRRNDAAVFQ